MVRRTGAGGSIAQLAGIGFGVGDHIGDRLDRQIGVDRKADDVGAEIHHRREVLDGIERRVPVEKDVAGQRRVGADHQRVAVGRRARHHPARDVAAAPRAVVDDHRLAPDGVESFRDRACRQVRHRARRVADHDGDRTRGVTLCVRRRGYEPSERANQQRAAEPRGHQNPPELFFNYPTRRTGMKLNASRRIAVALRIGAALQFAVPTGDAVRRREREREG